MAEKRKYTKRQYTCNDLIRLLKSLHGKKVRVFGQEQTIRVTPYDFLIDTIDIVKELKDYEIKILDLCKQLGFHVEKDFLNVAERDVNFEIVEMLVENDLLTEVGCGDNSYNWSSPVQNDFSFHSYKDTQGNYYTLFAVHLFGDVRGNYSDNVILKFDYDTQFLETLMDVRKYNEIEYCGISYECETSPLDEGTQVTVQDGEYVMSVYGLEKQDVLEEIKAFINERNEKLTKECSVRIIQMGDTELNNWLNNTNQIRKEMKVLGIHKDKGEFIVSANIPIKFTDVFEIV